MWTDFFILFKLLQVEDMEKQECVSDFSGWSEASKKGCLYGHFFGGYGTFCRNRRFQNLGIANKGGQPIFGKARTLKAPVS